MVRECSFLDNTFLNVVLLYSTAPLLYCVAKTLLFHLNLLHDCGQHERERERDAGDEDDDDLREEEGVQDSSQQQQESFLWKKKSTEFD